MPKTAVQALIFATPDFEVIQCSYDYEGAIGAQ